MYRHRKKEYRFSMFVSINLDSAKKLLLYRIIYYFIQIFEEENSGSRKEKTRKYSPEESLDLCNSQVWSAKRSLCLQKNSGLIPCLLRNSSHFLNAAKALAASTSSISARTFGHELRLEDEERSS